MGDKWSHAGELKAPEKKVQAKEKEIERMWKREKWTMKEIPSQGGRF